MKTTTLEVVIPDWAKWIAQDEDGEWFMFENEPSPTKNSWHSGTDMDCILVEGPPNPNWRETLRRVE